MGEGMAASKPQRKRAQSSRTARPRAAQPAVGWALVALALAVALAYGGSLATPFVFDDILNILENPTIRSLAPAHALAPPESSGIASRPLVNLTLALNHAVSGTDPWSYNLFNVLVHLVAGLVLFDLARRTLRSPRLAARWGRQADGLGFALALLWLLHPLQTQAVTYTIQRCESLMGLLFLAACDCAARAWTAPDRGRARGWQAGALAAFLLGLGVKEVIAALPPLLWLYETTFFRDGWRDAWRRSRGFYAVLGGAWVVGGLWIVAHSFAMVGPEARRYGALDYLSSQPGVILHYLRLSVWPAPLSIDYAWPLAPLGRRMLEALPIVLLLAATVWGLVRRHPLGFFGAWFFLILAPTSSIVPLPDLAFEHRMYLPLAAVVAAAVLGGYVALRRLFAARATTIAGLGLLLLLAVPLGLATRARNADYRSPIALWSATVATQPQNARAHLSLGVALDGQGRWREALVHLRTAVELDPALVKARINYAIALMEAGDPQAALPHLRRALELDPERATAHSNLGIALLQLGRRDEGIAALRDALRYDANNVEAHFNLALALIESGREAEARRHYEAAYRLDPNYVRAAQPQRGSPR